MKIKLGITGAIVAGAIAATVILNGQVVSVDNARVFIETEIADLERELEYLEVNRPARLASQKNKAALEKSELDSIIEVTEMGPKARGRLERRAKELGKIGAELDREENEEMPNRVGDLRSTLAQLRALLAELQ